MMDRYEKDDKLITKVKDPVLSTVRWVQTRSQKEKTVLMGVAAALALFLMWLILENHDTLFIVAEVAHFLGIGILAFKLYKKRSVAGLSRESQILTATFLAIRLYCSFIMEYDIHTLLDLFTLVATVAVIYSMVSTPLKSTYNASLDTVKSLYVIIPCLVLAFVARPNTGHWLFYRVMWAFCVYLESVSVLPQLRMMQNAKVVESYTAHYVFMLGLSRYFSCAHWILQFLQRNKILMKAIGSGLWPVMVLLSEIVQTGILADFCYYYIKAYAEGTGVLHLPMGIV